MVRDKNIGHCRVLKGGRITIPKEVREKLSVKDGDFVDFLLTLSILRDNQNRETCATTVQIFCMIMKKKI